MIGGNEPAAPRFALHPAEESRVVREIGRCPAPRLRGSGGQRNRTPAVTRVWVRGESRSLH